MSAAASTVPGPERPDSLEAWLRARSDAQLVTLLRLRPDLTLPAPPDLATLAARLAVRTSVQRALDGLDAFVLHVLDALLQGGPDAAVPLAAARDRLGAQRLDRGLDALTARGLVWDDATHAHLVGPVREIAAVSPPRSASASAGGVPSPDPPVLDIVERTPAELDALGAGVVLEALRLVTGLAGAWTRQPPRQLRSGGVGARDLRRTAHELGVDEASAAVLAETAAAAGLLNSTPGPEPVYLPTAAFDDWALRPAAQRWSELALAWLGMTRRPDVVNSRGDRDRLVTLLSPDVERGTVPSLRRHVLGVLAALPPGAAPAGHDEVLRGLAWRAPRRAGGQRAAAAAILAQADLLGVTAAGGLTGYTRTLLEGARPVAEQVLAGALPEPVDHFLVQPDLSVIVPGPPVAELAVELDLAADLESTGGAYVYRITEASVRRALDAGRTSTDLATLLAQRSRTPVPQALAYLIDDVARRHGRLRAGAASTYVRCEDTALLDRVLADRGARSVRLRRLAPTVLISDAPVDRVLEALREGGYAPAAEAADGEVIALGTATPRAPSRQSSRIVRPGRAGTTDAQRMQLVRRLRAAPAAAPAPAPATRAPESLPSTTDTSSATVQLLRDAIRASRTVRLGCADPDGVQTQHTILPISMAGGTVRGHEPDSPQLRSFPLHRLTSVRLVEDDDVG